MAMQDARRWVQVGPLLDEWLALPDDEQRAGFLARLAAEKPSLAGDLQRLVTLQALIEREGFLEGQALRLGSGAEAADAGQQAGPYVLRRLLGTGGMGVVWLAERSDGRYDAAVAVKLLNVARQNKGSNERFAREGRLLARLTHLGIARLIDAGSLPGGTPYLVLEYVDGRPIDLWCDERRLGVEARLRLFLAVLETVAHAHANLVLHRDLKPSNILVTPDGRVKLLDFGIARLIDDNLAGDARDHATSITGLAFTPDYAAPEQVEGGPMTTAVDVYALGVLLYGLLTGAHPTAREGQSAVGRMRALFEALPPRMSEQVAASEQAPCRGAARGQWAHQLRGDLDNIVAKALKKAPAERYLSVDALADDLLRHLQHQPVLARADSLGYRLAKFVRRHRAGVAAGSLAAAAIVAGVAGTMVQGQRAQRERERAIVQLGYAEAVEAFLSHLLSSVGDRSIAVSELVDRGEQMTNTQFADEPGLRARLKLVLSQLHSTLDSQDKATALLTDAQAAAKASQDRPLQARVACMLAAELGSVPDDRQANALFDTALSTLDADSELDVSTVADCLGARSLRRLELNDLAGALADARAALALLGQRSANNRLRVLELRADIAGVLAKQGEFAQAIAELERIVAGYEAIGRGDTTDVLLMRNNLGVLLYKAGQPLRAVNMYDRALAMRPAEGPGSEDEGYAALESNRAQSMLIVGRHAEALQSFDRALALSARTGDTRTPVYAVAGFRGCERIDAPRCEQRIEEARARLRGFAPAGHATFASLDVAAGQVALLREDLPAARDRLGAAVQRFEAQASQSPNRIEALSLLARTELRAGDAVAAHRHSAAAQAEATRLMRGFDHSFWLGEALLVQALAMQARGDRGAAGVLSQSLRQLRATAGEDAPLTREALALMEKAQP